MRKTPKSSGEKIVKDIKRATLEYINKIYQNCGY